MNMLKAQGQTYFGFMWVPSENESDVVNVLSSFNATEFSKYRAAEGAPSPTPPTNYKTNDMLEFH